MDFCEAVAATHRCRQFSGSTEVTLQNIGYILDLGSDVKVAVLVVHTVMKRSDTGRIWVKNKLYLGNFDLQSEHNYLTIKQHHNQRTF